MNLVFELSLVLTDFEKAAMNAVSTVLPASRLHGCRFLGHSWWRRIQALGLFWAVFIAGCVFIAFYFALS